jgi:tRNA/tmRNA/rRNA uracil-C5-methylase (TrmA/RlmC/RlmD family)
MGRPQQQQPRERQLKPFSSFLREVLDQAPPSRCRTTKSTCSLCWAGRLDYAAEQKAKHQAVLQWAEQMPSLPLPTWLPVESGRRYRRISKRRWVSEMRQLVIVERVDRGRVVGQRPLDCLIEPESHAAIYASLQQEMTRSSLGKVLNYAIIKSGEQGEVLLFNLARLSGERGELNRISKKLTHRHPNLYAVWLLQGVPGDDHYAQARPGQWQKLHGPDFLEDSQGLHYSPLSFTQVNAEAVPHLLKVTSEWLGDPKLPLFDLYCGYGLFSLATGRQGPCWGLELSGESVLWARRNARRRRSPARFEAWNLGAREIPERRFPEGKWVAVLDPPRGGAEPELIKNVGSAKPGRVMHWICDLNQAEVQMRAWFEVGYRVAKSVAVDMFPGTDAIELGLCLEPGGRLRSAKTAQLNSQAGTLSPCKPPKKPANSRATSTASGARPKPPRR